MQLFNTLLSEILFRPRLDHMDVMAMIDRLNSARENQSSKPFTLLEIKPYLQKLHDDSRIFLAEDEGSNGAVYVV